MRRRAGHGLGLTHVASWADVERIAGELPGATHDTTRPTGSWRVSSRAFVWERPLRPSDLERLGGAAPQGPVLGVRVPALGVKEALLADADPGVFTIPHFEGYPMLLVALDEVPLDVLEELVTEAWRCRASARLLRAFDDATGQRSAPS